MKYFAVIQLGYPVFGVGASADAAVADAEQWVDGDIELTDERNANNGDIVLVECTKALHDEVLTNGGDVEYETLSNGLTGLASEAED